MNMERGGLALHGRLRLITYLAPGLPLELFEAVGAHLERALGLPVSVHSDATRSAPEPGSRDPFTADEADVGFLCAPGLLWLSERRPPAVELAPAALQFDDPRAGEQPVFFADLVVRASARARSLADLAGARWVYNDRCSLSGYFSMLQALGRLGTGPEFFSSAAQVGSHHAALAAVASDRADCAAVDSNVLLLLRRRAEPPLRVIESFGPYPIQPVVLRATLTGPLKRAVTPALLAMHEDPLGRAALGAHAVRRFVPVAPEDYGLESVLASCGDSALSR
jgi:ABC-type phosphate/phosphonate transport system substrate-binding protein